MSMFVVEHAPWPVVVLDHSGAVIAMSRGARDRQRLIDELFQPEQNAALRPFCSQKAEQNAALRPFCSQKAGDRALAAFLAAIEAVGSAAQVELSLVLDGGPALTLSLFGTNTDGWRVIGIEDLTERRELELETQMLRRIESLGLLTARLVHDLNNLLTPVVCLSGSLSRALEGTAQEAEIRELEASAERAAALVRDMLSLGRPRPRATATDVNEVVSDLRPLAERLLGDHAELVLSLDETLPIARLDRARLEQALLNLVANARDAMLEGGRVVIGTRCEAGTDAETGEAIDGARIVLTVSDDGAGMSEDIRARVFQRVFTTKAAGTGLGLASVYGFVREAGGMVAIDSAPGQGTTIALHLPVFEPSPVRAQSDTVPALEEDEETGGVVLVVDRDCTVRTAARAAFEARGLRVVESYGGAHAFAMARSVPIDVALIDLGALHEDPGLSDRLRTAAPHMRVVWMSPAGEPACTRPLGRVLQKTFSEIELLRAVRDALLMGRSA